MSADLRRDLIVAHISCAALLDACRREYPELAETLAQIDPQRPDRGDLEMLARVAERRTLRLAAVWLTLTRLDAIAGTLAVPSADRAAVELLGELGETYTLLDGIDLRADRPAELEEIRQIAVSAGRVRLLMSDAQAWVDEHLPPVDGRQTWLEDQLT